MDTDAVIRMTADHANKIARGEAATISMATLS